LTTDAIDFLSLDGAPDGTEAAPAGFAPAACCEAELEPDGAGACVVFAAAGAHAEIRIAVKASVREVFMNSLG
jgi:hypothetical protein